MKYVVYLLVFSSFIASSIAQDAPKKDVLTIKIRKKAIKVPFKEALSLPETATSCDCPSGSNASLLSKLGCQHPDTAAVCKVVITQFDMAIIPQNDAAIVLKDVRGSFLQPWATKRIVKESNRGEVFISFTNIKGMTEDGKEVIVPSFGTTNPRRRASRAYVSIYDYMSLTDTKVLSFELFAYNADNKMIFKQYYQKDTFDKNAMRPDAVRYVFKNIKAVHSSGFQIEVNDVEVPSINMPPEALLSSN